MTQAIESDLKKIAHKTNTRETQRIYGMEKAEKNRKINFAESCWRGESLKQMSARGLYPVSHTSPANSLLRC